MSLEKYFPNLAAEGYSITSPATPQYNCIAWAAGREDQWWWPDPFGQYYWPASALREETQDAFRQAYESIGYSPCPEGGRESGVEKIAVYALPTGPTHAARQIPDGRWTSKLGQLEDIEHNTLAALEGLRYGNVAFFMKRETG